MNTQRIFTCFIFFIYTIQVSYCQESLKVLYKHAELGFRNQTELLINQNYMLYTRLQEADRRVSEEGFQFFLSEEHFSWLMDRASGQLKITRKDPKYEFYSHSSDKLIWDIQEETAEINGFKVQKAITKPLKRFALHFSSGESITYEGNVAVAWFAADLPYNGGPEGYYGLPGLILKLEYSERGEYFIVDSISYQDDIEISDLDEEGIELPYNELMNFYLIDKKWLKNQMKLQKQKKRLNSRE